MKSDYTFSKNLPWRIINEGRAPISEYFGDFIVMVDIPGEHAENDRNIWRISPDGEIRWKIWGRGSGPYRFTGFRVEDRNIVVYSASGACEFLVKPDTGEAVYHKHVG
jgi:hypothetical protein